MITPGGGELIVGETFGCRFRHFAIRTDGSLDDLGLWADMGDRIPDGCTLDAEAAIWFADLSGKRVVRIFPGGEIVEEVETADTAYACGLGGPEGRTLFVLTSATQPAEGAPLGTGRIWTVEVEVPHAGLP